MRQGETDIARFERVVESGGRAASVLESGLLRLVIDDFGGMVPEFSVLQDKRANNAHWSPHFRSNSGEPYSDAKHGGFWKGSLLYNIAGNFPCIPNFGPGQIMEDGNMPPHGWTANKEWRFEKFGTDEETGAIWARSTMRERGCGMDLAFSKIDMIIPGHPVHYTSIKVKNMNDSPAEICAAWHNTVGSPFLQAGCRISASASSWLTPPRGGEFDSTTRLALGAEFVSLTKAPLAAGGRIDISKVPGLIGWTDFAAGVVPVKNTLNWLSLVNSVEKLVYMNFFTGPAAAAEDDIILYFHDLWMQYGGRPFTPWAAYDGGTDNEFCLGMENSVSAFGYGLEYAKMVKKLSGSPTTCTIPARGSKTLRYGTLFAPYENNTLDDGIVAVEAEEGSLNCIKSGKWSFTCDPTFKVLKTLEKPAGEYLS
jgi:hypothetical protein